MDDQLRAVFRPASSWVGRSVHFYSHTTELPAENRASPPVASPVQRPLMHSINNSSWTWREPDTRVVPWSHIGNGEMQDSNLAI
jgi:hypothetical protein